MSEKETSDLSIRRTECSHCGAVWINGTHRWRTGATSPSSEVDLAGLVCNTPHGCAEKCINPQKGNEMGDTWQKRFEDLKKMVKKMGQS